jgi:hypothetical protein
LNGYSTTVSFDQEHTPLPSSAHRSTPHTTSARVSESAQRDTFDDEITTTGITLRPARLKCNRVRKAQLIRSLGGVQVRASAIDN